VCHVGDPIFTGEIFLLYNSEIGRMHTRRIFGAQANVLLMCCHLLANFQMF